MTTYEEFRTNAKDHCTVPVVESFYTDLLSHRSICFML